MYMSKSFRKTNKKRPRKQNRKSRRQKRKGGFPFFTKTPTTIAEIDKKTMDEFHLTVEELESFNSMNDGDKKNFIKDKTCLVRQPMINMVTGNPMPAGFTKVPNKYKCKKLCNVLKKIGNIQDCGDDLPKDACYIDGAVIDHENVTRNKTCNPQKSLM